MMRGYWVRWRGLRGEKRPPAEVGSDTLDRELMSLQILCLILDTETVLTSFEIKLKELIVLQIYFASLPARPATSSIRRRWGHRFPILVLPCHTATLVLNSLPL